MLKVEINPNYSLPGTGPGELSRRYDESVQILKDRKKGGMVEKALPESYNSRGIEGLLMLEEVARESAGGHGNIRQYQEMLANARIASGFYAGDMSYDITKEIVRDILGPKFARGDTAVAGDSYINIVEDREDVARTGLSLAAESARQSFLLLRKTYIDCRDSIWKGIKADKAYMEDAKTRSGTIIREIREWSNAKNSHYVRESFSDTLDYLEKVYRKTEDGSMPEEYFAEEYAPIEERIRSIKTSAEDSRFMEKRMQTAMEWTGQIKPGPGSVNREELHRAFREENADLTQSAPENLERELCRRNAIRQASGWQDVYRRVLLQVHDAGRILFDGPSGRS